MDKRVFEKLNIEAGMLGFGAMRLPCLADGTVDYEKSEKMIDMAVAGGVNYFDTAWMYLDGQSEAFLGKALVGRYPRDTFYIATKLPAFFIEKREEIETYFEDHFKRLKTDYIDFYLLHGLTMQSWEMLKSFGIIDFLEKKKAEGRIRFIGFSTHELIPNIEKIVAGYNWDFAQLQINYMDWEDLDAKTAYEIVERAGIPLVVMEPLRGGGLSKPENPGIQKLAQLLPGVSPSSLGFRWVKELGNVKVVLSGMNETEQVEENIKTFSDAPPLTEAEKAALDEAAKTIRALPVVPCTACRYCADCPKGIDIPTMFKYYNSYTAYGDTHQLKVFYPDENPPGRRAEDCVACGKCVKVCPQHIDVPTRLKDVAAAYEEVKV